MTPPQFADPASPTGVNYQELKGSLLMFEVLEVREDVRTPFSTPGVKNPAIRANLVVLDQAPGAPYASDDVLVFPRVLQGQLRPRMNQLVLGRLAQGPAKAGQSAPWTLDPATASDRAAAEAYITSKTRPTVSSAAEPPF